MQMRQKISTTKKKKKKTFWKSHCSILAVPFSDPLFHRQEVKQKNILFLRWLDSCCTLISSVVYQQEVSHANETKNINNEKKKKKNVLEITLLDSCCTFL